MAKTYGDRWQIAGTQLGHGGQGEVFPVIDLTGRIVGHCALKRVLNPARRQRFLNEIRAIKSLEHPNVIKLIDHSALDDDAGTDEKQFLVMPVALGGDLATRVKVYEGSLDGALSIGRPLASALSAAHAEGIVHRDVKPKNILFADEGNSLWLSDFGICLIRDTERATPAGEVAGPWAFMAPELEHGGRLDVTAAADVYSLGKLLFYIISGGIVLPRERLDDPKYAAILAKGGRFHLLDLLLRRMICPPESRIQSMAQVEEELKRIADWDTTSLASPISEAGMRRLEALQRATVEDRRVAAASAAERQDNEATAAAILKQLSSFAEAELEKAAAAIGAGDVFITSVRDVPSGELGHIELNKLFALAGVELVIGDVETEGSAIILQLLICRSSTPQVTVQIGNAVAEPKPPAEIIHAIAPRITIRYRKGSYSGPLRFFFLGQNGVLANAPEPRRIALQIKAARLGQAAKPAQVFKTEIASSHWPELASNLASFIGSVLDSFLVVLDRNKGKPSFN